MKRKPFGFRSGKWWKKIIAILYYLFLSFIAFIMIVFPLLGNENSYKDRIVEFLIMLILLIGFSVPVIVMTFSDKILRRTNKVKEIIILVISIIFSFVFIVFAMPSPTSFSEDKREAMAERRGEKEAQKQAEKEKKEQIKKEEEAQKRAEREKKEQAKKEEEAQKQAEKEKKEQAKKEEEAQKRAEREKKEQAKKEKEAQKQAEKEKKKQTKGEEETQKQVESEKEAEIENEKSQLTPEELAKAEAKYLYNIAGQIEIYLGELGAIELDGTKIDLKHKLSEGKTKLSDLYEDTYNIESEREDVKEYELYVRDYVSLTIEYIENTIYYNTTKKEKYLSKRYEIGLTMDEYIDNIISDRGKFLENIGFTQEEIEKMHDEWVENMTLSFNQIQQMLEK